jgi:tRNA/tmRNA/rRNA uracil-C5-methylase (TrmA/RlmC/RlmD family)
MLLYVSCDAESLCRDTERLTEGGRFRLERLTPYALFPYTDHVETLAELR